jgi:hypothetical protein
MDISSTALKRQKARRPSGRREMQSLKKSGVETADHGICIESSLMMDDRVRGRRAKNGEHQ